MKIITGRILAVTLIALLGGAFFGGVSGQTALSVNEQAVKYLRETGGYNSLRAALADARKRSGDKTLRLEMSETKLIAADGGANDAFGLSIAVSGNTVVVGTPNDDIGGNTDQGSAYIFVRNGSTWTEQTKLIASDGAAGDSFGGSVAISGDTAVVGSFGDDIGMNLDTGSAYIFTRSGTIWTQQAKLFAADGAAEEYFGESVAVSDNTAIVGSASDDIGGNTDQGSAYIFVRNGSTWTQQTKLIAAVGAAGDSFGGSVAISGDTAVVGSNSEDTPFTDQGAVYVFVRSGAIWIQQAKLTAADGAIFDYFGWSVAISGDTVIVGTPDDDIGMNLDTGSAYIFTRSGTIWTQQAKLIAADGAALDEFGWSVAVSGNTAVVGSFGDDIGTSEDQGSAYVFVRSGAIWTQQTKLTASDGAPFDGFGVSVAINGGTTIIGSFADNTGENFNQGSAYIFNLSNPRTLYDFDGDGKADVSVFRPSNGVWYLQQSQTGFTGVAFGQAGDKIVPADYDGDGKTDIAVFRPSNGVWYLQRSQLGFIGVSFGDGNDIPMPADYDGDGKSDIAVFRPSNGVWYIQQSTGGFIGVAFGANGDVPVAADYDADGKADVAVFRPSNGVWYLNRSQLGFTGIAFGANGDKPSPADYDGDGKADLTVFRTSNGVWYLQQSTAGFSGVTFGAGTDLPVPADYDGDGKADIAVFRESNGVWYLNRSTQGFTGIAFGTASDKPIPNAFVP